MSSLYEKWNDLANEERAENEYQNFWKSYFEQEKKNYEVILADHKKTVSGKISDLAEKFEMDNVTFMGFLDGINTSLVEPLKLEELSEDSKIELPIDYEKLYYNMLDAKANWLFTLPQWEGVLTMEKRAEITKEFRKDNTATSVKVGRNDPCSCGSGKKYKKCCGK